MTQKHSTREIRQWALVMTAALTLVGILWQFVFHRPQAAQVFWIIAAAFLLPGLIWPGALKPIYPAWLKFSEALGWFNTRLILTLTFFLVFSPIGLVLRLLGKDLIKERWDRRAASYWIDLPEKPFDPDKYENQY